MRMARLWSSSHSSVSTPGQGSGLLCKVGGLFLGGDPQTPPFSRDATRRSLAEPLPPRRARPTPCPPHDDRRPKHAYHCSGQGGSGDLPPLPESSADQVSAPIIVSRSALLARASLRRQITPT